jgi:hypothetical protein
MDTKFAYLMIGVVIVSLLIEQMPQIGGWLLLVLVLGALVSHRQLIGS